MKPCEGCGAPHRLDLAACDYCRRDYERKSVGYPTAAHLANLQAQMMNSQMNSQLQNSMGAAMGQHYNAFNNQQLGLGGWWGYIGGA